MTAAWRSCPHIAARLEAVDRLGASEALRQAVRDGEQGAAVLEVLTPADWAAWDRLWPAPGAAGGGGTTTDAVERRSNGLAPHPGPKVDTA